jgi:uncharacterized membrane protein YdjX (TVP38/TMEM64 family)
MTRGLDPAFDDRVRRLLFAVLAIVALAAAITWLVRTTPVADWLIDAARWTRDAGPLGIVAFALANTVATLVLVPSTALNIPTGLAFGFACGAALAIPISLAASTLAFVLGRSLLRGSLERRLGADVARIDRAVRKRGLLVVVLLRVTPIVDLRTTCSR